VVAAAIIEKPGELAKKASNWRTAAARIFSVSRRCSSADLFAPASPFARGGGRLLAAGENAWRRGVKAAMALEERRDGNMCGVAAASAMAWLAAWRHGGGA
jgi:hypothetical protein